MTIQYTLTITTQMQGVRYETPKNKIREYTKKKNFKILLERLIPLEDFADDPSLTRQFLKCCNHYTSWCHNMINTRTATQKIYVILGGTGQYVISKDL